MEKEKLNVVEDTKPTRIHPNLLTLPELAGYLKVKKTWVYMRTMKTGQGTIPRVKLGKYLRFDLDRVLDWIQEGGAG